MPMLPMLSVQLEENRSGTKNNAAFCHPLPILLKLLIVFCFHCLTAFSEEKELVFSLIIAYLYVPI